MSARRVIVLSGALAILAVACMDLFHSTDFETLCTREPGNAACGGDASDVDASDAGQVTPNLCNLAAADPKGFARHACGWLGACAGPLESSRFGPCFLAAQLAFDCSTNPALRPRGEIAALWACLATVKSCGDVDRCVFRGAAPPKCRDIPTGSFTACDTGNPTVRVKCAAGITDRPATIEPCALLGRSCVRIDDSRSACTAARGASCSGGSLCSGTSASVCETSGQDNLDRGVDCAGYGGGTCAKGTSPACSAGDAGGTCLAGAVPGVVSCEGDVAHVCVDGRDTPIDCARLGLSCDATNATGAFPLGACVRRIEAGTPCTDEDSCSSGSVESCAGGQRHVLDCGALNLGPCQQIATGAAKCTAPP